MSNALYLLIITAKNRLASKTFSILNGLKSWRYGLVGLLGNNYFKVSICLKSFFLKKKINNKKDLVIGLPRMRVKPYEKRVELEKLKYFLSDLTVDVSFLKETWIYFDKFT